ncbi:MAG TPA: site-2 protease family protein [Candidatus Saccharimonadales bacterium]|nr:site-2 protease family protein [Candidatus Saccharimonadales bacterium]
MSTFYSIDSTRVSHKEYWWGNPSPLVLIGWITKWLRIRLPNSTDDPNTESTYPFICDSLPEQVLARFTPLTVAVEQLGFVEPVYHVIQDPGTSTTIYWATFRHANGQDFARIHQRIWHQAQKSDRGTFVQFFTSYSDGTFLVSSSGKPDLDTPPTVKMVRRPKMDSARLWQEHLKASESMGAKEVLLAATPNDTLYAIERLHVLLRDFNLARGVFRPRTQAELASDEAFKARVAEASAGGMQHPEVLAELERLQTTKPGWGNAIAILVISIVAFIAAGTARQSWEFTLLLIPILLLHEAGHWLAMKVFGYRNLRMFFIPLFGAAVTGKHWNVPGWKKALVSLAGPVPGILLGVVLTLVGFVIHNTILTKTSLFLLLINGFNLLPVLPLDGGHVLHATLFCRNRYLDIAFRLIAIVGLILLSIAGMGKFFMYIAIPMAISLPIAFKVGKVIDQMRKANLPPPFPGEDRIAVPTAEAIITALKEQMPAKTSNKVLAQQALTVFETLNAKPPGALGTIGLMTVHGGAVILTVLCAFLLILDKEGGGLKNFARAVARQPQHHYLCGNERHWAGKSFSNTEAKNTIVSTFQKRSEAERAFQRLSSRLPATAAVTLAGDSLLLMLPAGDEAAREQWYTEVQAHSTNLFVSLSNRPINLSLMCIAPTASTASNLVQELSGYLQLAYLPELIPPWSALAAGPEWNKHRTARQAWTAIGVQTADIWKSPELREFSRKIGAAVRRGSKPEMEKLQKEQQEKQKELEARAYTLLKAKGYDSDLLELHARVSTINYTNVGERTGLFQAVSSRLGRLSEKENEKAVRHEHASSGNAFNQGLILKINWLGFSHPAEGLPALSDWLCRQGCRDLKYDFESIMGGIDEGE